MSGSSRLRVVFMGTSEFGLPSLRRLAVAVDLRGVVTQPDRPRGRGRRASAPPVKQVAEELGVEVHQPEKARSGAFLEELRGLDPEAIVVVAYGQLLPRAVLGLPRLGCVNVHPSLVPKYRGAAPIQWAIWNGESETGVTVMRLDEGEDSGPMLRQERVAIGADETAARLSERLADLGAGLLVGVLKELREGTVSERPQADDEATRAPRLTREMGDVDWTLPARTIYDHFRACVPWPGTTTYLLEGRRLGIIECRPAEDVYTGEPGRLRVVNKRLLVHAGDGCLELLRVQPENRAAVTADAYMNGLRGTVPPAFRVGPGRRYDME